VPADAPKVHFSRVAEAPTVSLIVLNWNGRAHLTGCLDSLRDLDYPAGRLELIFCDNGSTDGSADFVRRRHPDVAVVALPRNHGFAAGNDIAAEAATGEWVGFLNNDMRVPPSWLRDLLGAHERHPEAACLGSRIKSWDGTRLDFIGGGVNFQGHAFQLDEGAAESNQDRERRVLFACGGAMLIRRSRFLELEGFDRDFFAFFEDVDLGWRLNLLGDDVWYTPEATAFHHHHATARRLEPHRLRVLYERNALLTIYKCLGEERLGPALLAAILLLNERALDLAGLLDRDFELEGAPPGPRRRVRHAIGGGLPVRPLALSHWVGLRDFAHAVAGGDLQRKRAWLQDHRVRSDEDILPLMVDPFRPNYLAPAYDAFYARLTGALGLDRRFAP
jgi:GT2 family glycosyltransferase